MQEMIDPILITGILLSTVAFVLARLTMSINMAVEGVMYSQINTIVIATELVKCLIFNTNADYYLTVQRCASFVVMSTAYFFVALVVRTIGLQKTTEPSSRAPNAEDLNRVIHRVEELRHNISTKLQNIATRLEETNSAQEKQEASIKSINKYLQGTVEKLEQSLDVFKSTNPQLFRNTSKTQKQLTSESTKKTTNPEQQDNMSTTNKAGHEIQNKNQ